MRFHAEHAFGGSVDQVIGLLTDPEFHRHLQLPDVSLPDVVASTVDGDDAHLQLRYEFVGSLDPIASRLLGGRRLTWLQDLDIDRTTGVGRLRFAAEADPKRLYGRADFTIKADSQGQGSVRRLDGEFVVAVRPIGGMAERRIVPGLQRRLDIEAAALDRQLSG